METTALLFSLPLLVVLIFALIDFGVMFSARMEVASVARDLARNVAATGGTCNPRTHPIGDCGNPYTPSWVDAAYQDVWRDNKCTIGRCEQDETPEVKCTLSNPGGGVYGSTTRSTPGTGSRGGAVTANSAGDTVECVIAYPYRGINEGLLDSPFGLYMGRLLQPFEVRAMARTETGYIP